MSAPSTIDALLHPATLLASEAEGLLLDARRLASAHPGVHGRRRSGTGEDFWQFRDHRAEDGARSVDWRRSARGDRLFVREREMEAAQAAHLWVDPAPGFDWSADPAHRPTKRTRAQVVALALAMALVRGGERVGPLGGPSARGLGAPERLVEAWLQPAPAEPPSPPARAAAVLFSDFYDPVDLWAKRLQRCAAAGAQAALVAISDPAEEDFPFEGRVRFVDVSGANPVVFGRAQEARAAYQERLADHRAALRRLATGYGFPFLIHRTDRPPGVLLSELCGALAEGRR